MDPREKLPPVNASNAVLFRKGYGPLFGRRSLGVLTDGNMNATNNVYCCSKGANGNEFYNVKEDA